MQWKDNKIACKYTIKYMNQGKRMKYLVLSNCFKPNPCLSSSKKHKEVNICSQTTNIERRWENYSKEIRTKLRKPGNHNTHLSRNRSHT